MFLEQYVGKKLSEIDPDIGSTQGVCIFLLNYKGDTTGKIIGEDFDLRSILLKYPNIKDKTIRYVNNYYGELIFRVD